MGDGIANLSVIKNCWKYFPKNTALINGIIIGGLGLSSAVLTPIADYLIINREGEKPVDGIYPEEVALNLWNYLLFLIILFFILGIIGIILTIPYKEELNNEINESDEASEKSINMKSKSDLKLLCEGFFSCKNFMLLIFCFCGPCKIIFI